jgi:diguanylate cyclase (GGDEF)-like protein
MEPSDLENARTALRNKTLLFAVLIGVAMLGAAAIALWIDYHDTRQRNELTVTDVAKLVEKHVHDTVAQADGLLGEMVKTIVGDGGVEQMSGRPRWEQLRADCRNLVGCKFIGVVDPHGRTVAVSNLRGSPGIEVSDRNYFLVPKRTGKLFVDAAIVTRLPGNPIVFNIAKPAFDASGKLLAVVSIAMNTQHFTSFYRLMGFALDPTVIVFRKDGGIVARNPDMASAVGRKIGDSPLFTEHLPRAPSGTYHAVLPLDGKTRIAAYRTIPKLDLVVFAGIEKHVALQAWEERAILTTSIIAAALLLILGVMAIGYRSLVSQLALETKNRELVRLSHVDSLTRVANRRRFDDALQRDWARHLRSRAPLSLLMIDIDHFKQYNDRYGHQAGDECLRRVAQALQACLQRGTDLLARYGGEEFAAILDGGDQGALTVAQRMRQAVEALAIPNAGSQTSPHVTVSIGLAASGSVPADSAAALLQAADRALYGAKAGGRNRVCAADDEAPLQKAV